MFSALAALHYVVPVNCAPEAPPRRHEREWRPAREPARHTRVHHLGDPQHHLAPPPTPRPHQPLHLPPHPLGPPTGANARPAQSGLASSRHAGSPVIGSLTSRTCPD